MADCVHSLNFNGHRVCIPFFPIETFVCNCSSFQKKQKEHKDQIHVVQSFLQRQDITKIKLLVGNSAITVVNELKNIWYYAN